MRKSFLSLLVLFCGSIFAQAQNKVKVEGIYSYSVPSTQTIDEAKHEALQKAKIQALQQAFSASVTSNSSLTTTIKNQNAESHFYSKQEELITGEWLETIGEPSFEIKTDGEKMNVIVKVKGYAKAINQARIDIQVAPLRNGTSLKYKDTQYNSDDSMYLYFKTPADGYLAVYMLDEQTRDVYCLLPYQSSNEGIFRVKHDMEYILFSPEQNPNNPNEIDELVMTCGSKIEHNTLYVIFSSNSFAKSNISTGTKSLGDQLILPKSLPQKDFKTWLTQLRLQDKEMCVKEFSLTINPSN